MGPTSAASCVVESAVGKTVVFGIVERAGKVVTRVVPNVRRRTLEAVIVEKVRAGSTLSTDELASMLG